MLSAICEAMAPGYDGLPAAEREVDVSGPVSRFVAELPPRSLARLKLGLRAFEDRGAGSRTYQLNLVARPATRNNGVRCPAARPLTTRCASSGRYCTCCVFT